MPTNRTSDLEFGKPEARSEIVIIGPQAAGKSTIGPLLSTKLRVPEVHMDNARWDYYLEIGYSQDTAKQIASEKGFLGQYRYWKRFEIYALEQVFQRHSGCVFHLGAGHSVYEDRHMFARAQAALRPFKNVILLMPSPDRQKSIRVLDERLAEREARDLQNGVDPRIALPKNGAVTPRQFNSHFVNHKSNWDLATAVVYTDGKVPEETAAEIIELCRERSLHTSAATPSAVEVSDPQAMFFCIEGRGLTPNA